jgi:uncharacterized protein (TIGR00369 family)
VVVTNTADRPVAIGEGRHFGIIVPFLDTIGLVPLRWGGGIAVARLPWRPDLINSRGGLQGGSLMTALDFTMSAAARAAYEAPMGAATIDMHSMFLETAPADVTIEARCLRAGRSIAFCEGEAKDERGAIVVRASATFRMIAMGEGA